MAVGDCVNPRQDQKEKETRENGRIGKRNGSKFVLSLFFSSSSAASLGRYGVDFYSAAPPNSTSHSD
jgi:hypothetical protein